MNDADREPRPGMGRGAAGLKAAGIAAAGWLATIVTPAPAQDAAGSSMPVSTAWNIASSGKAESSGELLFRVTPADGEDPVEVTVFVLSGSNETGIASSIRRALATQLDTSRFDIESGQGANVLVTTESGTAAGQASPGFSLELVDSDVENVRVMVQNAAPVAPPTVPPQTAPANPPLDASPANPGAPQGPGQATPPASRPSPDVSPPATPIPNAPTSPPPATPVPDSPTSPPPATPAPNTPVNPTPPTTTPPGSTPGPTSGGEGANAPPPSGGGAL